MGKRQDGGGLSWEPVPSVEFGLAARSKAPSLVGPRAVQTAQPRPADGQSAIACQACARHRPARRDAAYTTAAADQTLSSGFQMAAKIRYIYLLLDVSFLQTNNERRKQIMLITEMTDIILLISAHVAGIE